MIESSHLARPPESLVRFLQYDVTVTATTSFVLFLGPLPGRVLVSGVGETPNDGRPIEVP